MASALATAIIPGWNVVQFVFASVHASVAAVTEAADVTAVTVVASVFAPIVLVYESILAVTVTGGSIIDAAGSIIDAVVIFYLHCLGCAPTDPDLLQLKYVAVGPWLHSRSFRPELLNLLD